MRRPPWPRPAWRCTRLTGSASHRWTATRRPCARATAACFRARTRSTARCPRAAPSCTSRPTICGPARAPVWSSSLARTGAPSSDGPSEKIQITGSHASNRDNRIGVSERMSANRQIPSSPRTLSMALLASLTLTGATARAQLPPPVVAPAPAAPVPAAPAPNTAGTVPAAPTDAASSLERVRASYEYGDIDDVVEWSRPIAEGRLEATPAQRALALRYLGIGLYLTGRAPGQV